MQNTNYNHRKSARFAGVMYLLCMLASISGGLIVSGIIDQPDFINKVLDAKWTLIAGMALELVNALGLMGIAAAFWVAFKDKMPATAAGYLSLRSIEVALCMITAFIPIILIQLAGQRADLFGDIGYFANRLVMARDIYWAYVYPVIFFISGSLFYSMLYKTVLVPKYIAVWGMVALLGVLAAMFAPSIKYLPGFLIITNEIYLGIYLIARGFRTAATERV